MVAALKTGSMLHVNASSRQRQSADTVIESASSAPSEARMAIRICAKRARGSIGSRWCVSYSSLPMADGGVGHAVGEAPLVVVPGQHAHQPAVDDLRAASGRRSTTAGCG